MHPLEQFYEDRMQEINAYLSLLSSLEISVQSGVPHMGGTPETQVTISAQQQRILYSSLYLQLYNFVEATISRCLDGVCQAVDGTPPCDLVPELRSEWARSMAQTHKDINYDRRLERVIELCDHFVQNQSISSMKIEVGGGGNFHDGGIFKISKRLGCPLNISQPTALNIKKHFRNGMGSLRLIAKLRNDLAHGNTSFGECGENVSVSDLRNLTDYTAAYLKEVILSFKDFIDGFAYIVPERRPVNTPAQ